MSETKELICQINQMYTRNKKIFYPYIEYIRFPKFKSLLENTRIDFNFPVTLLVGVNGGNKTSILQALYGVPDKHSIGEYWFSTDVDKIQDGVGIDRQCFIYGHYLESVGEIVEVLKTRIEKKDNPDYWEPSRPNRKYDMKIYPKEKYRLGGYDTRWPRIEKEVVYCDCKEYVSAFDLFFYHGFFASTKTQKRKQDFIRCRSKHIAQAIASDKDSLEYYGENRISDNIVLDKEACKVVSGIMGEDYSEIRIITHSFYTHSKTLQPSKTIWIKKNGQNYSEAFAGSGEARIILLVHQLMTASNNSLILMDEPEISLHPRAIYRLKNFILEQVKKKKFQVVITTHSPQMVKGFPREAIKLALNYNGKIEILQNVNYQDAFIELGEYDSLDKKQIFVEDELAKEIIQHVLRKESRKDDVVQHKIGIKVLPGGASTIINKYIASGSIQGQENTYYWLDGDMKPQYQKYEDFPVLERLLNGGKLYSTDIPESDDNRLGELIMELTGKKIDFYPPGNRSGANEEVLIEQQRSFIDYWAKYVDYLPWQTPELELAKLRSSPESPVTFNEVADQNGKDFFMELAKKEFDKENVTSEEIFTLQKLAIPLIDKENWIYKKIKEKLEILLSE